MKSKDKRPILEIFPEVANLTEWHSIVLKSTKKSTIYRVVIIFHLEFSGLNFGVEKKQEENSNMSLPLSKSLNF